MYLTWKIKGAIYRFFYFFTYECIFICRKPKIKKNFQGERGIMKKKSDNYRLIHALKNAKGQKKVILHEKSLRRDYKTDDKVVE